MGNRNSGRRPTKTIEQHKADGTYRHDRHGARAARESNTFTPPDKPAGRVTATARSQRRWIKSEADERAVRSGHRFNEALAEHVVTCFRKYLRHSKGQWAGQAFELTQWQQERLIYPLFGWVREDGTRRFRRSYIEIPKKNYKSTTAAGVGMYMLTCDGEAGAEIYSLGADKDQARIVHSEAISMVEASPELDAVLMINRTTGAISFPHTKSWYKALSAAPRGKAGLNIHCGIADELHEWQGDSLWNAIKYGYRARRQPLQLVITNAGDDMDGICRHQHDKARGIINGTVTDDSFFALILSASKEEAMAELKAVRNGATELPVARRCNPGIGHVITELDVLNDVRDAIDTPTELPNLLRLTYSVWAIGSQPWLDIHKWNACEDDCGKLCWTGEQWQYTPGAVDLSERACWGGLDLSKNRDLTAFSLVFPDEDTQQFWTLPVFWLPEETALQRANLARYEPWAADGLLRLIEGEVIDYDAVERDIVQLSELFDVREILYDPWQADPLRQRFERAGLFCTKFEQSMRNFASPTEDFERLVSDGKLRHSGNDLLTWQAGHVEIKTDLNKNKRPVKRAAGDYRTIDGIVATIMGLFGALTSEPQESFYDDHEVEAA